MNEQTIERLLRTIIHPETGADVVASGFVRNISVEGSRLAVTLRFAKPRDPFAQKLRREAEQRLREAFPEADVSVAVAQPAPAPAERPTCTREIRRVVAIASGKGGVGKSTLTANLAVALRDMGYRVGVLDADIYGPSQPRMFGVEGFVPEAVREVGVDRIVPAEAQGIRLMSIGFFIRPDDALLWRGAMATNALRQLIHDTKWGALDFLLVDLPPGTGDIHLSIVGELRIDAAVIVSTPQHVATMDVRRGIELFRHPNVAIPVAGVVENMAWFTPEELPDHRYYLFGRGGARRLAEACGVDFLGEVPIIQSIMESSDAGRPAAGIDPRVGDAYRAIASGIVDKVSIKP